MKRRALLTLLVCAVGVWLAAPVFAQTRHDDGEVFAAEAKRATARLQFYLDDIAKGGGVRPDLSRPPASDLVNQAFNLGELRSLPPAQANDLPWLMDWATAANGAYKSILFFGIARPVNPQTDAAAIARNFTDYEDQEAAAGNFLLRITAREIESAFAFMDWLPPAQRTQVRIEGFTKIRAANAQTVISYLGCIVMGMKPANARLISAAVRDTGADWAMAILPADRPAVLATLAKAEAAATDEETRGNLSSFAALLTNAK